MQKKVGTVGYMAPEILIGQSEKSKLHYQAIIDMFSMGSIFYLLVTGEHPFDSEFKKEKDVYESNLRCHIEYYSGPLAKIPNGIVSMLQKMLTKDPLKRISAKDALAQELFDEAEKVEDLKLNLNFMAKNAANSKTQTLFKDKNIPKSLSPNKRMTLSVKSDKNTSDNSSMNSIGSPLK